MAKPKLQKQEEALARTLKAFYLSLRLWRKLRQNAFNPKAAFDKAHSSIESNFKACKDLYEALKKPMPELFTLPSLRLVNLDQVELSKKFVEAGLDVVSQKRLNNQLKKQKKEQA